VVWTAVSLVTVAASPEIIGAVPEVVEVAKWKPVEWILRHSRLARWLGWGGTGTAIAQELADGDDDELRAAQELLEALRESGGRIPLDQLDESVMATLQQLGEAVYPSEEFAVIVAEDGQMYLLQMSQNLNRYGLPVLPEDTVYWWFHTHYGLDAAVASGADQSALWYLGDRIGQFFFSTVMNAAGESSFFLPEKPPWVP
jgi:hypothetical protein